MSNLSIKRVNIPFKYADNWKGKVRLFDIKGLKGEVSPKGSKIMFVVDRLNKKCIEESVVLTDAPYTVFTNILNKVIDYIPDNSFKEFIVVPYNYCSSKDLSDKVISELKDDYKANIFRIAKKYKPDLIVLLGTELSGEPNRTGQRLKIKGFQVINSLSLFELATPIRSKDEGKPSCSGYLIMQLVAYLNGLRFKIPEVKPIYIDTIKKFDKFYKDLKNSETPCFDTETSNLARIANKVLSLQICTNENTVWFLPYKHKDTPFSKKDLDYINKKMASYFENNKAKYHIYHNAKFDLIQERNSFNFRWNNAPIWDTMASSFALDENRKFLISFGVSPYTLGQLALEYGSTAYLKGDIAKEDRDKMETFSLKQIMEYGSKDVIIPYYIVKFQKKLAKIFGDKEFEKTVTQQIGPMIQVFVEMECNGVYVDKRETLSQMAKTSVFNKILKDINEGYKNSPNAQEANKRLLQDRGLSTSGGLWGNSPSWVFDIAKEAPKEVLFFDVMDLEAVDIKKNGNGKTDKDFQKYHKDVPEVQLLTQYNRVKKLKSSYIDATFKRFEFDEDLKKDGRLRCQYSFAGVVTGRASSSDPNLQQIPSHSQTDVDKQMVTAIRRQFICSPTHDYIQLHADYSAHEVRNWGNISGDEHVCRPFRHALDLQRQIRIADYKGYDVAQLLERFETEGDVHKQNYKFFFGEWPTTKEQRSSVKAVVFGIIYGKGAGSLSIDINDTIEKAKELIKIMFSKFKKGGQWLKSIQEIGNKKCIVAYPNGRKRHLWANVHPDQSVKASMCRKGPNSIVQGFSSDCNFTGGYILQKLQWDYFGSKGIDLGLRHLNVVHDSIEAEAPLANIPIGIYLMEHAYTTLIHKRYREIFGFKFTVDLVMEFDIGPASSEAYTWDFRYDEYFKLVDKTLKWKKDNLGIDYNEKNYRCMKYNFDILRDIRYKEILRASKSNEASEVFLLDQVIDKLKPYDINSSSICRVKND